MAEASAHKLAFVEEATRGTTPTNPRFQRLPDTRTTLALVKDTLTSERLRGNRFPDEPRTGASTVAGDVPNDLSFRAYNPLIESALQGAFSAVGTPPSAPTPVAGFTYGPQIAGQDVFEMSISVSTNLAAPITIPTVNEGSTWLTTSGSITVESVNDDDGEVIMILDDGATLTPYIFEVATNTVIDGEDITLDSITGASITEEAKAGDTRKSFSLLREFSDFDPSDKRFLVYVGCEVTTWSISAAANGLATSTFSFIGRSGGEPQLAEPTGTTYIDSIQTEPFDTFNGDLKIDGVSTCIVTDYTLNINNNMTPRYAVGCDGSQDPVSGQSVVDGSITVYFEDHVLYENFINETSFAIELTLQDPSGNQLLINLPNLRALSGTQPDVSGDGPITLNIPFSAHEDDTAATHVVVTSIEAP